MTIRKKEIQHRWEHFLCERMDTLDNSVYHLLKEFMMDEDDNELPWTMELIGEMSDCIEAALIEQEFFPCRPYYEGSDETPCYLGNDCKNTHCPFRKELLRLKQISLED